MYSHGLKMHGQIGQHLFIICGCELSQALWRKVIPKKIVKKTMVFFQDLAIHIQIIRMFNESIWKRKSRL
jgi:hypothetical protein